MQKIDRVFATISLFNKSILGPAGPVMPWFVHFILQLIFIYHWRQLKMNLKKRGDQGAGPFTQSTATLDTTQLYVLIDKWLCKQNIPITRRWRNNIKWYVHVLCFLKNSSLHWLAIFWCYVTFLIYVTTKIRLSAIFHKCSWIKAWHSYYVILT